MIFTEPTQMSLHPGEHIGEDGLIYCDICKTPRQVSLYLFGELRTFRCQCLCQQARMQEERDRLQRQEAYDRFARLQSVGMQDPSLREYTFAASRYNGPVMRYAKNYVDHFQSNSTGLLLWGPVGTGKTYFAACIANALMARGISVLMTNFGRILGALPGPASGERTAFLDDLVRFPLLILDDFGAERDTPYALEMTYYIIDARYRTGKPLILTTNLSPYQLENPDIEEKARIYDRVLECCFPIQVQDAHVREEIRQSKYDRIRKKIK